MNFKKLFLLFIINIILLSSNIFAATLSEDLVTVPAAIMVETTSGNILYEKKSENVMYPASTTKMLTSIIAIENCSLDDEITVPYSAIYNIPSGYSTAGLITNEILTVEQLLNLTLIESANDAANVLAIHIAGSEDSFASIMNTKASEIGCKNSHFTNSYGRHDDEHYSTAYDLYLIANYAMHNEYFRKIVRKSSYITEPTNEYPTERTSINTNLLLRPSSNFYDTRAIGIKTGFTTPAGNCLVSCFKDNNLEIIVVVLGAAIGYNQYKTTLNLINYAFDTYSYETIWEQNALYTTIEVENATSETKELNILVKDEIVAFMSNEYNIEDFSPTIELNEKLSAPIKAGEVVGSISYNVLDKTYTSELIAANDVEVSMEGIIIFVIFSIILIIATIFKLTKKRKK